MAAAGAAVSGRAASVSHLRRPWKKPTTSEKRRRVWACAHAARLPIFFFKAPSLRHGLVHTVLQPQIHHPLMQPRAQRTSSLLG